MKNDNEKKAKLQKRDRIALNNVLLDLYESFLTFDKTLLIKCVKMFRDFLSKIYGPEIKQSRYCTNQVRLGHENNEESKIENQNFFNCHTEWMKKTSTICMLCIIQIAFL